ncbi:microtubule binding protein, partial [Chytridium lagenaria]
MTESKTELLTWLNDLLQIKYTKIEQCGSGAAYCQILDSVYAGDVPLTRVKFESKHEYDFVNNLKILQTGFNSHSIEKNIPIDKLIKCRYNDNLEFLQWMKKYWDAFYPGGGYDATARRAIKERKDAKKSASLFHPRPTSQQSLQSSTQSLRGRVPGLARPTSASVEVDIVDGLTKKMADLQLVADTLERERNFYYLKLRDLEVVVLDRYQKSETTFTPFLREIQTILYSTEEGFVAPK